MRCAERSARSQKGADVAGQSGNRDSSVMMDYVNLGAAVEGASIWPEARTVIRLTAAFGTRALGTVQ